MWKTLCVDHGWKELCASWLSAVAHISSSKRLEVNQNIVNMLLITPLLNITEYVAQGFKAFMLLSL